VSREPGVVFQPGRIGGALEIRQTIEIEETWANHHPSVTMQNIYGQRVAPARAAKRHTTPESQPVEGTANEPPSTIDAVEWNDQAATSDRGVWMTHGGSEEILEQRRTVDAVIVHGDYELVRVTVEERR